MDAETFFSDPTFCYLLDGILVVYCLIATAFFFREKFSSLPSADVGAPEENGLIYEELDRTRDADPYEVLDPSKRKKRAKKKPKPTQDQQRDTDPDESLATQDSAPPLPPSR
ncbi:T-cell surface glycoprotein CD3 zeta chain [Labrus bergylta]|uniref:T-cell surface glycoprotein CD3 zeta chain n=1 Tax=Labrus bergylta TaxID=56723 RepID=UPI003313C9CB